MQDDLDAKLLDAHRKGDLPRLVRLYEKAARAAERDGRADAAAFYMTHAYVFALEAGSAEAARLKDWLVDHDRETEG